jgi:hypothetical protein
MMKKSHRPNPRRIRESLRTTYRTLPPDHPARSIIGQVLHKEMSRIVVLTNGAEVVAEGDLEGATLWEVVDDLVAGLSSAKLPGDSLDLAVWQGDALVGAILIQPDGDWKLKYLVTPGPNSRELDLATSPTYHQCVNGGSAPFPLAVE